MIHSLHRAGKRCGIVYYLRNECVVRLRRRKSIGITTLVSLPIIADGVVLGVTSTRTSLVSDSIDTKLHRKIIQHMVLYWYNAVDYGLKE